eukprot:TRINITY_DN322_c0_g1_i1.p1 TRINITY_DN322_c0_g1~~TRINITY_DN322_c0_g1_i1.p1  ORF type:complete len:127 (-),score=27.56 TRINITY_DN322_c0_g1_i1:60-401(-)
MEAATLIGAMGLEQVLQKEINRAFKAKWTSQRGETLRGTNWAVAITKEESNYPVVGPKHKKTSAYVIALDRSGNVQEKEFYTTSRSWTENSKAIFPKINAWIFVLTGENSNLQ